MRSLCVACSLVVLGICTNVHAQNVMTKPSGSRASSLQAVTTPIAKLPSEEDLAKAAAIKADIELIQRQIEEAKAESAKLVGGLIKSRIDARVAQMQYTISLLQTRQKALEIGARNIPVDVVSTTIDDAMVVKLDKEIEEYRVKIKEAEARAAQYTGGLIRAQILSTVATMNETLAMMDQRRLISKYGLATAPSLKAVNEASIPVAPATKQVATAVEPPLADTIIKVRLSNKQFQEGRYDKSIFFDGEYQAEGLDKPARSIKGVFKVQDLFGETKLPIKWTINEALSPGQAVRFSGKGIDYNQFINSHQWLRSTAMADMQIVFSVESIIYQDGTRKDF